MNGKRKNPNTEETEVFFLRGEVGRLQALNATYWKRIQELEGQGTTLERIKRKVEELGKRQERLIKLRTVKRGSPEQMVVIDEVVDEKVVEILPGLDMVRQPKKQLNFKQQIQEENKKNLERRVRMAREQEQRNRTRGFKVKQ